MTECPSPELLAEFLDDCLAEADQGPVAQHLRSCSPCQRTADQLSDDASLQRARHLCRSVSAARIAQEFKQRLYRLISEERALTQALDATGRDTDAACADADTQQLSWGGEDAAALSADEELPETGRRLGRFWLRCRLGIGGFGVVYLADDPVLEREVALKLPKISALADPEARSRVLREARAAAGLRHPNIVSVHEANWIGNLCYIASAYCSGPTLAEWIKQSSVQKPDSGTGRGARSSARGSGISPRPAAEIVRQLAEAVEHAHHNGILHRDIKPQNVLLQPADAPEPKASGPSGFPLSTDSPGLPFTPMLTDFGTARLIDGPAATASGVLRGTPRYMAPEQASGRSDDLAPPTDVYALGAMLYELLASRPPIEGRDTADTLRRVLDDEPVPLRRFAPQLPRDLEAICLKCLEKSPARRYQTAGALAEDLRRFLAGEPIQARSAGRIECLYRWARRDPSSAGLVAVSVLGAALLFCGLLIHTSRLDSLNERLAISLQDERASREQAKKSAEHAQQLLYVSDIRLAEEAWKRHDHREYQERLQRWRPEAGAPDRRGFEWHYLWQRGQVDHLTLTGHEDHVYYVCYSPDGRRLASAGQDGTVRIWDPLTGEEQLTLDTKQGEVNCVAFSPDGSRLASAGDDGSISIRSVDDGTELLRIPAFEKQAYQVAFSPDGQLLISCGNDAVVRLWDARSGQSRRVLEGHQPISKQGYRRSVEAIAVSSRGGYLASASDDRSARIWDARTGKAMAVLEHPDGLSSVVFSPDGRLVVTADVRGTVQIHSTDRMKFLHSFKCLDGVQCLNVSPGGEWLALGDRGGAVRLSRLRRTWAEGDSLGLSVDEAVWQAHPQRVWSVAFSPDRKWLASAGADGVVNLWNRAYRPHQFLVDCGDETPHRDSTAVANNRLCTAGPGGLFLWDLEELDQPARSRVNGGEEHALSLSELKSTLLDPNPWRGVRASPDKALVASWDERGRVAVWNVATGRKHGVWSPSNADDAACTTWSPDGKTLVVRCGDVEAPYFQMIDLERGEPTRVFSAHETLAVAFSPDGASLALGRRNEVVIRDFKTKRTHHVLKGHTRPIEFIAFSPDGRWIASGSEDRRVKLWDVESGTERFTLLGHVGRVTSLAFSPDGRSLVTADRRGKLIVWNVATGQLLWEWDEANLINELEFSHDGGRLIFGHLPHRLRIFDWRSEH